MLNIVHVFCSVEISLEIRKTLSFVDLDEIYALFRSCLRYYSYHYFLCIKSAGVLLVLLRLSRPW